jgi:hypothetical protein
METVIPARINLLAIAFCLLIFGPGIAQAQTTNTCVSPLNSDNFTKYDVVEGADYVETNSAGTVPNGSNFVGFSASVKLSTNLTGTVSVAVLTLPGQNQPTLMREEDSSDFSVIAITNSFSNLTAAFPDGTYQFTVSSSDISVTLPAGSVLPNPPTLADFTADQSIDSTKDYTIAWIPFNTGGVLDFISFSLTEEFTGSNVFKSGDFGCPGALDGTATSILIPSHTLASNTTYRAQIDFIKAYTFDTNSIPDVALLAGTESDTAATIATGPGIVPAAPPALTNAVAIPGGGLQFDFTTTPGLTYTVQFNSDLSDSTGWSTLLTTNAAANSVSYTNSPPSGTATGYYRVIQQ